MEKIITFNLSRAMKKPINKRHRAAIKIIKQLAIRHGKGTVAKISTSVNQRIKYFNIPKKLMVKLIRKDNIIYILDPKEQLEEKVTNDNKNSS